jgi:hypothetical protein
MAGFWINGLSDPMEATLPGIEVTPPDARAHSVFPNRPLWPEGAPSILPVHEKASSTAA